MALNVTTNYAGKAALDYLTKAFYSSETVEGGHIRLIPNVKSKMNITKLATGSILQADGCAFNASGDLTLTESVLEVTPIRVNTQACLTDLLGHWEEVNMRPGSQNDDLGTLPDFITDLYMKQIAEDLDGHIWSGDTLAGSYQRFDGFSKLLTADGGDDITGVAGGVTAANVLDEIAKVYDAIPSRIKRSSNLRIYVAHNVYDFYVKALASASGNANFMLNQAIQNVNYIGIPIVPALLPDGDMIAAETNNLVLGTDLLDDTASIRIVDMRETDGSDQIRFVMKFKAGVQYAYRNEIIKYAEGA